MEHDENKTKLYFSEMLRELLDIPFYRVIKRFKLIKQINKFAKQHKDCCDIDFD